MMSLMALVAMTMMSCSSVHFAENNGADKTPSQVHAVNQVTTMSSFDEVEIAGGYKVVYEQGTEHSVRI